MERAYIAPDFDVALYDVEDVITLSVTVGEGGDDGDDGWMDF